MQQLKETEADLFYESRLSDLFSTTLLEPLNGKRLSTVELDQRKRIFLLALDIMLDDPTLKETRYEARVKEFATLAEQEWTDVNVRKLALSLLDIFAFNLHRKRTAETDTAETTSGLQDQVKNKEAIDEVLLDYLRNYFGNTLATIQGPNPITVAVARVALIDFINQSRHILEVLEFPDDTSKQLAFSSQKTTLAYTMYVILENISHYPIDTMNYVSIKIWTEDFHSVLYDGFRY